MDEIGANDPQALKGRNSPEDGSKETESQVLIELPILYFITTVLQFFFFLPPPGARALYLYPAISEGYRCCCKAGEESPDSEGQPIPLTAGHLLC